ncbi:MAG TPA: hypothetical protein V6C69_17780 [Trichormus sp.]
MSRSFKQFDKLWLTSMCALLTTLVSAGSGNCAHPPAKGGSWNLTFSSSFAGNVTSQFNTDAVRMSFDKLGITVITKAPKWDALVYSETNKSYMEMPHNTWKDKFNASRFGGRKSSVKHDMKSVKTGKSTMIAGQKADLVVINFVFKNAPPQKVAECWMADRVVPPPAFVELMHNMLNVPTDQGMPLRVTQFRENGKSATILDTTKVEQAPVPTASFVMPKGFKKVEDEMQLMVDDSDLDFMTAPKKKPATPAPGAH